PPDMSKEQFACIYRQICGLRMLGEDCGSCYAAEQSGIISPFDPNIINMFNAFMIYRNRLEEEPDDADRL
ncbi:MAG: hypothetical protein IJV14_02485, partial [Lachnospiraceae bacterium]|nr:hypothetical protein [Lachnospiraceae bacterium]